MPARSARCNGRQGAKARKAALSDCLCRLFTSAQNLMGSWKRRGAPRPGDREATAVALAHAAAQLAPQGLAARPRRFEARLWRGHNAPKWSHSRLAANTSGAQIMRVGWLIR